MKLVIELNDADLRHAVEAQVSKAVDALASAVIDEKVSAILALKFERMTDDVIARAVSIEAGRLIGVSAQSMGGFGPLLRGAAFDALKHALRENGVFPLSKPLPVVNRG